MDRKIFTVKTEGNTEGLIGAKAIKQLRIPLQPQPISISEGRLAWEAADLSTVDSVVSVEMEAPNGNAWTAVKALRQFAEAVAQASPFAGSPFLRIGKHILLVTRVMLTPLHIIDRADLTALGINDCEKCDVSVLENAYRIKWDRAYGSAAGLAYGDNPWVFVVGIGYPGVADEGFIDDAVDIGCLDLYLV